MFSFQKLLGKEDLFFGLLEASATEAHNSVQILVQWNKAPDQPMDTAAFVRCRQEVKQLTSKIRHAVYTQFVTALDREDIDALGRALYRIPKAVEKFGERIALVPLLVRGVNFSPQISLLEQAVECVLQLVKSLRTGPNLEEAGKWNEKLQQLETEADKLILNLYRDLFSGSHDPLMLKDLFDLLEKGIDRCRDAGHVMSQIILKHC